jgi:hypothetical protein
VPYDLGGVAVLNWTVTDVDDAPAAPGGITATLTLPDGSTATPTPQVVSTGVYQAFYPTTQCGRHTFRWVATGTPGPGVGVGAGVDSFDVEAATAGTILSMADCRETLNIAATNTSFDTRIRAYNSAITGVVEKLCGPVVVRQVTERYLENGMSEVLVLRSTPVYQPAGQTYPIISITPIMTYGLTWDLSLIAVDPITGVMRHTAGLSFFNGPYDVTYMAGRPIVPDNIMTACRIILRHLWALERGGTGAASQYAADDVTMLMGYAIPNRALELLDSPGSRDPGGIA